MELLNQKIKKSWLVQKNRCQAYLRCVIFHYSRIIGMIQNQTHRIPYEQCDFLVLRPSKSSVTNTTTIRFRWTNSPIHTAIGVALL